MSQRKPVTAGARPRGGPLPHRFRDVLHRILAHSSKASRRDEFLRLACSALFDFSACDRVEVRVRTGDRLSCFRAGRTADGAMDTESWESHPIEAEASPAPGRRELVPEPILRSVLSGHALAPAPFHTRAGSFWTGDAARPILMRDEGDRSGAFKTVVIGGDYPSLALLPIPIDERSSGALTLASTRRDFFTREDIQVYEAAAETLGVAIAHHGAQWALRERVKELTCLYGIATVLQRPARSLEEQLSEIAGLLPPGWQYPESTCARIVLDGRAYATDGFRETAFVQNADVVVNGSVRGRVEVAYLDEMPEQDEGPFLREERSLIDQVASQIALLIERRESARERAELQEQLRHADRLATIGQLAAGAAHELNEPLGSILGFAQLAKDSTGISDQTAQDMDKIVNAAIHAREIIKKLMIFARQMPTNKARFDLNQLIREGFYFLESRCAKEGIAIERQLDEDLPEITADPSQLHQVLVNLMVNAIQAMPRGGTLTLRTRRDGDNVLLSVEDTGTGMSEEVLMHMFVPFFTTKEVGQGTGLGLSVVHGIVTAHGGRVRVESEQGQGSRFEISLPISGSAVAGGGGIR